MRHRLLAAAVVLAAAPALAHHGWSSYDTSKVVTLEAPIVESHYRQPHGEIVMEQDGKRWQIVLAPPSRMQSRGLPPEDIAVGKVVKVEGYAHKTLEGELRAERVIVAGRTVELR